MKLIIRGPSLPLLIAAIVLDLKVAKTAPRSVKQAEPAPDPLQTPEVKRKGPAREEGLGLVPHKTYFRT